jgi:hypothetical protein
MANEASRPGLDTAVWQNTPRDPIVGRVADALDWIRGKANESLYFEKEVPLVGGTGAGDLLMGGAPEEVDNWSYGNAPTKERFDGVSPLYPDFKRGRAQGVADVVLLPFAEALAAGKAVSGATRLAGSGLRAAADRATAGGFDVGRREAMKKIGRGLSTAALATGGVGGLKHLGESLALKVDDVAPAAVKASARGSPMEFFKALAASDGAAIDARRALYRKYDEELARLQNPQPETISDPNWEDAGSRGMDGSEDAFFDDDYYPEYDNELDNIVGMSRPTPPRDLAAEHDLQARLDQDLRAVDKKFAEQYKELRATPEFVNFKTPTELVEEVYFEMPRPDTGLDATLDDVFEKEMAWKRARRARLDQRLEEEFGILSNDKVMEHLRSGGVYVDPRNGSQATISGDGKYLKWTDSKYGNPLNGGYGAFR